MGEVTTATIVSTPKSTTPTTFRFISGFALPSMHHNNSPLLKCPIFETSATALCGTTGFFQINSGFIHGLWFIYGLWFSYIYIISYIYMYQALYMVYGLYIYIYSIYVAQFTQAALPGSLGTTSWPQNPPKACRICAKYQDALAWPMDIGYPWKSMIFQWEFQDPKMALLYHIRPYFVGISPYIGLKNRPYIC